jgi:hypothetical protein
MRHLAALYFSLTAIVTCTLAQQNPSTTAKSSPTTLEYMGAAGWRITDGTTVILIDPYLSRILGPAPPLSQRPLRTDRNPCRHAVLTTPCLR